MGSGTCAADDFNRDHILINGDNTIAATGSHWEIKSTKTKDKRVKKVEKDNLINNRRILVVE